MIILPVVGLFLSIRIKSRFSRYAAVYFGLQLFIETYQNAFSYLIRYQIIDTTNPALIGWLISIPGITIYLASYGILFLALKNIK